MDREPAFEWGEGPKLWAHWAEHLSQGLFATEQATLADDAVTASNRHVPARFAPTAVDQEGRSLKAILNDHQEKLFAPHQTCTALDARIGELFERMRPLLNVPVHAEPAALWCLNAYTVLLAPWSPVQLRVKCMGCLHTKGFTICAARDLAENEFIYELAGLMSIDLADNTEHTDLSTVAFPEDGTRRLLFGPICLLNHHCEANAETNHRVSKGEELSINYGQGYWKDDEPSAPCPCSKCTPERPPRENKSLTNPKAHKEVKRLANQRRRGNRLNWSPT
ncbi:hypothetical protein DFH06DRAFT_1118561 [Mycena polygramma]|nr:hypothetical protein DFH06DRAFT_1118561 [Mycena polygramma]